MLLSHNAPDKVRSIPESGGSTVIGVISALIFGAYKLNVVFCFMLLVVQGVFIIDVNEDALHEVQEELAKKYGEGKIRTSKCDVSSMDEMEGMVVI